MPRRATGRSVQAASSREAELERRLADLEGENDALRRGLDEALERQTVTSEVLQAISRGPTDLERVLSTIASSSARLTRSRSVSIRLIEGGEVREGAELVEVANHGTVMDVPPAGSRGTGAMVPPLGYRETVRAGGVTGRAVLERRLIHAPSMIDLPEDEFPDSVATARSYGNRSMLVAPLLRGGNALGVIVARRWEVVPFAEQEIRLLATFADQAVIAIENARLFRELQERTGELTRSVEQLTALFEVSQTISSSLDLGRVLDAVIGRAVELAGADGGSIYEYDRGSQTFVLRAGAGELATELAEGTRRSPLTLASPVLGRAARERAPIQIPDLRQAGFESTEWATEALTRAGFRALIALPLLHEDTIVGALAIRRRASGTLPPATVDLLQTFANQSALAIQNARLFQELVEKSRQLEEASQHKSEFLANMSHELRTPLNAVIGFTEVLLERYFGEINEKQDEYLRDVLTSGQHLLSLINDILDLSKVEAGRMELELGTFELGPVLEAGLVMVRERASRAGVALSLAVADGLGRVEADERKVKQVLFNLLTNAVKFTPAGGRVSVSARRTNGTVEVAVADTGIGIAPEEQDRVFEEFGQARGASGQSEGTGLGLALCKRFVELHGGTIRVESAVGTGSTFTCTLPVRQPARAAEPAGAP